MTPLLDAAHPLLAERYLLLSEAYRRRFAPWFLRLTCVHRSPLQQQALYAQGREGLTAVNQLRARALMAPITVEQNTVVTWTLRSRHTRYPAEAVDVVACLDEDGDGPMKARVDFDDLGHYRPLVPLAEQVGLVSGGSWRTPDWPHLELPPVPLGERA